MLDTMLLSVINLWKSSRSIGISTCKLDYYLFHYLNHIYRKCKIQDFVINLGKNVTSLAGFFNMVVNTIFRVLPLFNDGLLTKLDGYVDSSYELLG